MFSENRVINFTLDASPSSSEDTPVSGLFQNLDDADRTSRRERRQERRDGGIEERDDWVRVRIRGQEAIVAGSFLVDSRDDLNKEYAEEPVVPVPPAPLQTNAA